MFTICTEVGCIGTLAPISKGVPVYIKYSYNNTAMNYVPATVALPVVKVERSSPPGTDMLTVH